MKRQIFLLEHHGFEDDIYVRGVYSSRAAAEEALTMDEERGLGANGRPYFTSHADWCCGVDERWLLDAPEPVEYGPRYVPPRDALAHGLIPESVMDRIIANMERDNLWWRNLLAGKKPGEPIGHVTKVDVDEEGFMTFEAKLD